MANNKKNNNESEYIPDWLKKCLTCKHAYKTQDNDLEWKCRCRTDCNYKKNRKHSKNT